MNINYLFKNHHNGGGFIAKIPTKSGKLILSIVAGEYYYSTPREDLSNVSEYSKFEVAIFNSETNKWASYNEAKPVLDIVESTGEYEIDIDGDESQCAVLGWVEKELIIKAIELC